MPLTKFEGVRIQFCLADSPAARAGVRKGDRLLIVNGMRIENLLDFAEARERQKGRITLTVLRGNRVVDLTFDFEATPSKARSASEPLTEAKGGQESRPHHLRTASRRQKWS